MDLNFILDYINNLTDFSLTNKLIMDLLGYIAIIISILGFISKDKFYMRFNGMVSTLLFGISIYFYNGVNGLFVSLISFFTKLLSLFIKEEKLEFIKILSPILAFIMFFYFNTEGIFGLLPALSLIFIMIADIQSDIIKMKQIYFGSAFCWLLYGIVLGSIPAILFDVFGIMTLIYSIRKIKKDRETTSVKII